jgi:hypothetical protein
VVDLAEGGFGAFTEQALTQLIDSTLPEYANFAIVPLNHCTLLHAEIYSNQTGGCSFLQRQDVSSVSLGSCFEIR